MVKANLNVHGKADVVDGGLSSALTTLISNLASDLDLPCTPFGGSRRDRVALSDNRDRWLVPVYDRRDFSPTCPTELTGLI